MTRRKAMMLMLGLIVMGLSVLIGIGVLAVNQLQKSGGDSTQGTTTTGPDSEKAGNEKSQVDVAAAEAIAHVDRTDRDAVAILAAHILSTWDPSVDQSESSAVIRAKALIDPMIVELNSQGTRPADNALWMEMGEANAVTKPFVEIQNDEHALEERPNPDALTVLSTWDWVGPSLRTTNPQTRMFFMQMRKNEQNQWEIADYTYSDVPTRYLVGTLE